MTPLSQVKEEDGGQMGPALAEAIGGLASGSVPEIATYKGATIWGDSVKAYLVGDSVPTHASA